MVMEHVSLVEDNEEDQTLSRALSGEPNDCDLQTLRELVFLKLSTLDPAKIEDILKTIWGDKNFLANKGKIANGKWIKYAREAELKEFTCESTEVCSQIKCDCRLRLEPRSAHVHLRKDVDFKEPGR